MLLLIKNGVNMKLHKKTINDLILYLCLFGFVALLCGVEHIKLINDGGFITYRDKVFIGFLVLVFVVCIFEALTTGNKEYKKLDNQGGK